MLSSDRLEPTDGYWPVVLMLSRMLNRRLPAVKVLLLDWTCVVKYASVPPPALTLSMPIASTPKSVQRSRLCVLTAGKGMAAIMRGDSFGCPARTSAQDPGEFREGFVVSTQWSTEFGSRLMGR